MPKAETTAEIEKKILDSFAGVASMLGYSSIHGKIIGILIIEAESMPIQAIAKRLNYSLSSISISVDFLDAMGVIKKFRNSSDKRVHVKLSSGLLDALKKAILIKLEKSVEDSLADFAIEKEKLRGKSGEREKKLLRTIGILESEVKKLKSLMEFAKNINLKNE